MYTDKITQAVAEAVKQVLTTEKLHPNQQKLDVHQPEKDELTSKDFEMLRKGKKAEVKEGWQDMLDDVKKRAAPQPNGGAGMKQGSRYGGSKQKDEPEDKKPMKEEATGDEFKNELKKAQDKSMGKDKAEVSKASTQAVRQEAVEQIDELSKETLKSYGKKAYVDATQTTANAHDKVSKHIDKTGKPPSSEKQVMKIAGKEIMHVAKRTQGLARAETRLAKEEVLADLGTTGYTVSSKVHQHPDEKHYNTNTLIHRGTINGKKFEAHSHINHGLSFKTKHNDAEQAAIKNHLKKNKYLSKNEEVDINAINGVQMSTIEEKHLTEPEMKKKEEVAKSMKKGLAGFKARYGDRAKSVMYATATKIAKDKA